MEGNPVIDARINEAEVNNSRTVYSALVFDTFDNLGLYQKTDWQDYQLISENLMDKIEDGIYWNRYDLNNKYDNVIVEELENEIELTFYSFGKELKTISFSKGSKDYNDLFNTPIIPTKVSELENDSDFITEQELEEKDFPTKEYVDEQILQAQLDEKQEIDLSDYARKTYVDNAIAVNMPTKVSDLINDSNFINSIPNEYITEIELDSKGYLTEIPSQYITEQELNAKDYSTKKYVTDEILKVQLGGEVDLSNYAPISNPRFINSISLSRKTDTQIGVCSVALGLNTTATSLHSIALGYGTTSKGLGTSALGYGTIANANYQIALGKYNVEDTENKYAFIYGNGTSDTDRKNIHTLNWNGNAWYQGNISIDGTPTNENDVVTKSYVDNAIENIDIENIDLSGYATLTYVDNKLNIKYDDVIVTQDKKNVTLSFYSNNKKMKDIQFKVNSDDNDNDDTVSISSVLSNVVTIKQNNDLNVPLHFSSPNEGEGTVKMFMGDTEIVSQTISQGRTTITIPYSNIINNTLVIYAIDSKNITSNTLTIKIRVVDASLVLSYTCIKDYDDYPRFDGALINSSVANSYTIEEIINSDKTVTRNIRAKSNTVLPSHIGFQNMLGLIKVDYLDTSNVITMENMFSGCTNLTYVDASNWDTSKVRYMNNMFCNCYNLTDLDVSSFDTSNVGSMENMFSNCYNLTELNVSNFDTSNVSNMKYMFNGCHNLTDLDVSNFNTRYVGSMKYMFYNCYNLTNLDLSNFDTSKVGDMEYMFYDCHNLTNLDLSNWDTSNVTNMRHMFFGCCNLTTLNLSNFNINTSYIMVEEDMFYSCISLTNFKAPKKISANIDFRDCPNLTYTSLMSIINALETNTGRSLYLNIISTNKLSVSDIAIATAKGWDIIDTKKS